MDVRELKRYSVYVKSKFIYKLKGVSIGKRSYLGKKVKLCKGCSVGDYNYIGEYSTFHQPTIFGNFCLVSDQVNIIGNDHFFDKVGTPIIMAGVPKQLITTIHDDVWIGHAVSIKAGSEIGEGAIIGSNSVITKNIPPYEIWAGSPAKKIRDRLNPTEIEVHSKFLKNYREGLITPKNDREI